MFSISFEITSFTNDKTGVSWIPHLFYSAAYNVTNDIFYNAEFQAPITPTSVLQILMININ